MRKIFAFAFLASLSVGCTVPRVQPEISDASDFRAFMTQWERAQSRFINADPTPWKENASHGEDATVFGAFGGYEKSWKEVGPRYVWASSQFKESGATQKIEYLNNGVSGDLAFTVAIERQLARIEGQGAPTPRSLRVTQIFRKEAGVWKLLHRHADPLVERLPPAERR